VSDITGMLIGEPTQVNITEDGTHVVISTKQPVGNSGIFWVGDEHVCALIAGLEGVMYFCAGRS
jgi:hypothetical protein